MVSEVSRLLRHTRLPHLHPSTSVVQTNDLVGSDGSSDFDGLVEKSEENQVNTLIYTMGDTADDIFQAFMLQDEDKKKYEVVKEKFEKHYIRTRQV